MMKWEYAKVFISSSFIDMHAERDYLVKDVFPELEEWCENHKIHLTNIDLRWGVSEDTSKNNNTIEKCLTNIDGSRPFFLCFLGQRRGWIPDYNNTLTQSVDWSKVNQLSFEYRLNTSVSEGTLSVSIGSEEIFKDTISSKEWNTFNFDASSFNDTADLVFSVESGSFNIKSVSGPIENGDFSDNTASWSFTGDVRVIKDDADSPYVLLNGSHISQETRDRYNDIIDYEHRSATEMEIEHALLSPLHDFLDNKENVQTKHSLFFIRDESSIDAIKDPHKRIYTNYSLIKNDEFKDGKILDLSQESKDIIEEQDKASADIIDEIKAKKELEDKENKTRDNKDKVYVKVTDYTGEWNESLEIPAIKALGYYDDEGEWISRFENNEWVGRLTNFKAEDKPLKKVIIDQLKEELKKEFPDNFPDEEVQDTKLQSEINQQDIFCHLNTEGYISRTEYEDRLWEYVKGSSNNICLVTAKAGLGKTMLLAKFATDYEEENKDKNIYKRFCGASDLSSKTLDLWQTIIEQAGIQDNSLYPDSDDELKRNIKLYPNSIDELKRNIKKILEAISEKGETLIIIDAVNQMSDGIKMLKWLEQLPDNVKMIVSIKEDKDDKHFNSQLQSIKSRSVYDQFEIEEIDDKGKRELMEKYLEGYLKELDEKQIDTICEAEGSENPLYLKILLAELRVFASFEQLKEEIASFGDSPLTAFNHMLERLESDEEYMEGENLVPLIFSLLAASRSGLTKKELVDMIKTETEQNLKYIEDTVNVNLRQVKQFMSRKEGRDDFFYETFRLAAEERYSKENIKNDDTLREYFKDKKYSHEILADYFMKDALIESPENIPDDDKFYLYDKDVEETYQFHGNNIRSYNELPYHLNQSGSFERLEKTLSSYSFIKNKIQLSDIYNIISDYQFRDIGDEKHPFLKEEDHPIILIGRALELSAPILTDKKNLDQLPAQLWGRMNEIEEKTITDLLDEVKQDNTIEWLKSTKASLYSPKSSIIKRLKPEGKESTTALAITKDKKLFIGNEDGTLEYYDIDDNNLESLISTEVNQSKIIKIIILMDDETDQENEALIANSRGTIYQLDINDKSITEKWNLNEEDVEITDIYYSKTYNKIYMSSHKGIFTINIETDEIRREDIENKNYNHIFVPRRNEAILVADEKEVDGWDVYEMRKAYNQHHQHELTADELGGSVSNIKQSSGEIRFMGLIKRFLILISENGQMKMWNTLKNSGSGESIDEEITTSPQDTFAQAITLEDEHQVITMSEMGVLRVYDIPEPRNPTFRFDKYDIEEADEEEKSEEGNAKEDDKNNKDIQTGITDTTAMTYYRDDENKWVIVGNNINDINIIDLDKQVKETEHTRHIESVMTIKLNDEEMITASDNGEYYKWTINDDRNEYIKLDIKDEENKNKLSNDFRYDCLSYNQTQNQLICCGTKLEEDGNITNHMATWNINQEEVINEDKPSEQVIDIVQNKSNVITIDNKNLTIGNNSVALEKEATTLATNYEKEETYIGFTDGTTAKYTTQLDYYEQYNRSPVEKIKVTNDKIIVGHKDGKLEIYADNGEHQTIDAHDKRITNIHVLDDNTIITLSEDKTLKRWDISTNTCTYVYYLDIYATSINMKDDLIIVGDSLGNVRFFNF